MGCVIGDALGPVGLSVGGGVGVGLLVGGLVHLQGVSL